MDSPAWVDATWDRPQNPGGPNNIKLFGSKPPISKKRATGFSKLKKN